MDRERDLSHPEKRLRPIASGRLSKQLAAILAGGLALLSLGLSLAISGALSAVLAGYGRLNIAYSVWLKHVVIADVFCIAIGFVLRVIAGGLAIDLQVTSWLIIATFLLALFLGLGKRRHELTLLEENSGTHRPILGEYSPKLVHEADFGGNASDAGHLHALHPGSGDDRPVRRDDSLLHRGLRSVRDIPLPVPSATR